MSEQVVQLNESVLKVELRELVRQSVEETLNKLLEAEAAQLTQSARYERTISRQGYRSGHYTRHLTTSSGDVTLHMPRLKGLSFQTAIIERYRRRESSVEEAMVEMYLAGVSTRRIEDVAETLWGSKVSSSTVSALNKKAYGQIEQWRNRPLKGGKYPYVYVDGLYLRRNWGGEYDNVSILVAIAVNQEVVSTFMRKIFCRFWRTCLFIVSDRCAHFLQMFHVHIFLAAPLRINNMAKTGTD